jgi:hypothetical protein
MTEIIKEEWNTHNRRKAQEKEKMNGTDIDGRQMQIACKEKREVTRLLQSAE